MHIIYMTKTKEAQEAIGRSYGIYQVQFICQGHCNKMHCKELTKYLKAQLMTSALRPWQ